MFVCIDTEWRTVLTALGARAFLLTVSFGREDGSSASCTLPPKQALRWLVERLSGRHTDEAGVVHRQHAIAFHFTGDAAVLTRNFDPEGMHLIRKAQATLSTVLCGSEHPPGELCPKVPDDPEGLLSDLLDEAGELDTWAAEAASGILHRYRPGDVSAVITEGGEGDVLAYDPETHLAVACTPTRRFYVEHRPAGDRYEGWRRVDIHDIGTAIPGGLEKAIEDWNPELSERERELITWGKQFRKGWPTDVDLEQVAAYSEAECVATARIARKLLTMIRDVAHVPMQERELFGSGSVAGAVMKHNGVAARKDSHTSDQDVGGVTIDELAKLTYLGGLIETPVIGLYQESVDEDDINSAYPDKIRKLPCMRDGHGEWHVVHRASALDPTAVVGHALVSWALTDRQVRSTGPFTVRRKDCSVMQPRGASKVWVSLAEYRAAVEQFGESIIAHKIVYWESGCECSPFDFIDELYDKRQAIKAEMKLLDPGCEEWWHLNCQQATIKLILNSMYGKMAQQRPVLGKYTNLHLASYITGATRAQVRAESWKREAQGGMVVYQHTDSVLSVGGEPTDGGKALGAWGLEKPSQDMLILQPGLATALGGGKTATRGCSRDVFTEAAAAYAATTDLSQHPTKWPKLEFDDTVMITRRVAMATGKPEQAGAFVVQHRSINPVSPKRDMERATKVPGQNSAWVVPILPFAWPEDVASLHDIKAYRTELEKRSRAGEFDSNLH